MIDRHRPVRDPETGAFDPDSYDTSVARRFSDYRVFQDRIGETAAQARILEGQRPGGAVRVLDLGIGTGATTQAVLNHIPSAAIVGVDSGRAMLDAARTVIPSDNLEALYCQDLQDPLPDGPFDLVVSALAIHHIDHEPKQRLYRAIADRLRSGGRFVQGDLHRPEDASDDHVVGDPDCDIPAPADQMVAWLNDSGLHATLDSSFRFDQRNDHDRGDVCIIIADKR